MNWLHYLAEANIYLGVFYLAYCVFLTKVTYYQLNRGYLIFSCLLSFILPVIQLGFLKHTEYIPQNTPSGLVTVNNFTWQDAILYGYLTGVVLFILQFVIKLYQIQKLAGLKSAAINGDYKLIYLEGSNTAFSFFNYLFIGTEAAEPELITRHELVHIRQKHSADVIFLEMLKTINWFNPVIYLLQNSLKTIHEYIADEETALIETDPTTYSSFLVNNAYGISGPSFTHSFFNYNLLKKRIIMLHQKRSGGLARLKYLMAIPLCAGLLCESTLGFSKSYGWINLGPKIGDITVDTIKKKMPPPPPPAQPTKGKKVINVILVPPPPPPVPAAHAKKTKRFPPPVIRKDGQTGSKADVIKFPPPIIVPAKGNKPAVVITDVDVRLNPPPAAITTKKAVQVQEIRIEEPAKIIKPTGNEIRIDEPARTIKP